MVTVLCSSIVACPLPHKLQDVAVSMTISLTDEPALSGLSASKRQAAAGALILVIQFYRVT